MKPCYFCKKESKTLKQINLQLIDPKVIIQNACVVEICPDCYLKVRKDFKEQIIRKGE